MIPLELSKQARTAAIASIQRYFQENLSEPIGDLPAGFLLNFFLEDVGPSFTTKQSQTRRHACSSG